MKIDENLASVHAYLCADGYVIKSENPKHSYYYVGLRNTNEQLLTDFQTKCKSAFGITPIITKQRDRCKFQNKKVCLSLLDRFGSFHSDRWTMPRTTKRNLRLWLRAYFDCDGWVSFVERKDRKIGLDSINYVGLKQIQAVLKSFGIDSSIKPREDRNIWTLSICSRDDLEKFENQVGFLHPDKKEKLRSAMESYVDHIWRIPENLSGLRKFVTRKGRVSLPRNEMRFNSILRKNLANLKKSLSFFGIKSNLRGPWTNPYGTSWYCLSINLNELNKLKGGAK